MRSTLYGSCILVALAVFTATLFSKSTPSSTPNAGLLLVVNKADRTLSIVDPEAGRQLAAVPVKGITGHEVAASSDGQSAWVPIYGNSGVGLPGTDGRTVTIIDLKSRAVAASRPQRGPWRTSPAGYGWTCRSVLTRLAGPAGR